MFRARKGCTYLMLVIFATFGSIPARAALLHFLVKADFVENAAAVSEKIPTLPMMNCKPRRPVVVGGGEIVVILECGEVRQNDWIGDILMMSQLEHVKSVNLFATENATENR
jgi:hypothetical protein